MTKKKEQSTLLDKVKQNASSFIFNIETMAKKFTQPSQTVPDQTMSLKELLNRYAKGQPFENTKEPLFYGDDGEGINPATLDLSEREYYTEQAKRELKEIQDRLGAGHKPPPIEMRETEQHQEKIIQELKDLES